MTTRVITSEGDRQSLFRLLANQKLPFTVNVVKGRKRSVEQNKLQRLWMNEIAEQSDAFDGAEEVRAYCKLRLGVPILRAEDDAFCAQYDKHIRPKNYGDKLEIMAVPLDWPVTRLMSVDQKTRYLDAVNRHFAEQGVVLTQPEMAA